MKRNFYHNVINFVLTEPVFWQMAIKNDVSKHLQYY